jgi:uncharacterized membrane protein YwzB
MPPFVPFFIRILGDPSVIVTVLLVFLTLLVGTTVDRFLIDYV